MLFCIFDKCRQIGIQERAFSLIETSKRSYLDNGLIACETPLDLKKHK